MTMVKSQHVEYSVALGKNDDRGVGEAYVEVPIPAQDCCG